MFTASTLGEPAASRADGLSNTERQRLRREVSSLERKMESRRAELEQLQAGMGDINPTDFAALSAQQQKISEKQEQIDELETAWLEASEALEGN